MIGVQRRAVPSQIDWRYLGREAGLILLFAWALPIAGGMDGLISFRGQAGSALVFSLVAGAWLAQRLWARRSLPVTGLEWPLVAFVFVQATSTAFAAAPRLSLPAVAQTLAYIVLFYLALDLARSGWPAELVEKCLLIGGAIVLALASLELVTAFQGWLAIADLPLAPPFEHRLYAVVGDANILAGFTNILWPIALSRLLASRHTLNRILLGAIVVLALVIQAFCYSRGATLALAVAALTFAIAWAGWVSTTLRQQVGRVWSWLVANPIWLVALCLTGAAIGAGLGWRLLVSRNSATQAPAAEARTTFWTVAFDAFQAHPLVGVGPGAFPQAMSTGVSTPPEHLFMNAHSQIFNTLAETGGLGLAAGAVLIATFAWGLWRSRRTSSFEDRARWAATTAAWAAFVSHGFVDYHVRYLALAVPLLVMAALSFAAREPASTRRPERGWPVWALAPVAVLAAAFSVYQLTAAFRFEQATLAGRENDWQRAAQRADLAFASDPAFSLYAAQAGYAYAQLTFDAPQGSDLANGYLDLAIQRYVSALQSMPGNAVWEMNLAVLLDQDGDRAAALKHLDLAQSAAPGWGTPAMLRGLWTEADDEIQARSAFADALEREPSLADAALWQSTSLRRGVLAQWQANVPATTAPLAEQIQHLVAAGRLPEAQQLAETAHSMNASSPWVYRSLAALASAQGAPTLAARYLEASNWLQTVDMRDRAVGAIQSAELALSVDDRESAAEAYALAWDASSQVSPFGWGYLGYTPTAHFIFQRDPWAPELVPQMPQLDYDAGLAADFAALIQADPALAPMTADQLERRTTGSVAP